MSILTTSYIKRMVFEEKSNGKRECVYCVRGVVSPLLANIYLNELDRYMKRYVGLPRMQRIHRRKQRLSNFVYIRYADDFVVLCNGTKQQAEELKQELYNFLREQLRLRLSKEKTKITHLNDGFTFLGFWIQRCAGHKGMTTKILIPQEAVRRVEAKIKAATTPTTHQDSVNSKILAINRIIGGWCRYYQYTSKANTTFRKISPKVFWQVAHWLGRKHEMKMTEVMKRYHQGDSFASERYRLNLPHEFETLAYKKRFLKENPYTKQESVKREELLEQNCWSGHNERPGMADLRPMVLKRDEYICQMCDKPVRAETAEVDHIKRVSRFKRAVDANRLENLWTLCIWCHREKTKSERQMESRMR
ncbi:MAG TPA: reverse transcriptase domain-containing protein [Candidatus Saccharimonadales bacterium]|nr:reverse transcriptase domain-containing protein [Candidatus Saccharimonadales bacterium]